MPVPGTGILLVKWYASGQVAYGSDAAATGHYNEIIGLVQRWYYIDSKTAAVWQGLFQVACAYGYDIVFMLDWSVHIRVMHLRVCCRMSKLHIVVAVCCKAVIFWQEHPRLTGKMVLRVLNTSLIIFLELDTVGWFMFLLWFGFGNSRLHVTSLSFLPLLPLGSFQGVLFTITLYLFVFFMVE